MATIYQLTIERFRGIQSLKWAPAKGLNFILGGGDVGKTTILDAIGLLFSPTNATTISDTEYYRREDRAGFSIEAVVGLPSAQAFHQHPKQAWVWAWNGKEAVVPGIDDGPSGESWPAYRLRVRGTDDLELVYELVQPDGTADHLSVGLRRAVGLVRIGGDDRNDRDLRLVQGSALDRLLSDRGWRARLAAQLKESDVKAALSPDGVKALEALDETFASKNLPCGLDLAITSGQGFSVSALVGLTASAIGVPLPLASWGSGTRRLAALAIAEQNQSATPITLVDEVERGLEPYRQRNLIEKLQAGNSQVFATTHSPFTIAAASNASFWYMDQKGVLGELEGRKISRHRERDPETFLARLTIVGEGITEVGFASVILERSAQLSLAKYGIHIADGEGQETTLGLLEALSRGGLQFGGFVDNEAEQHSEGWTKITERLGDLLFRWHAGCAEENVMSALANEKLEAFMTDAEDRKTGSRLRTLATRLELKGDISFARVAEAAGDNFKSVILEAALGKVPAGITDKAEKKRYKAHAQDWFKTEEGGRELAGKVFGLGLWPALSSQLLPFCDAVRKAVGLPALVDAPP